MKWVIFTDLDGTLLDHQTYSFEPAREALKLVKERGIPLCIVTSKTRAEVEEYRRVLDNRDPFIVENGGALFVPSTYFPFPFPYSRQEDGYKVIEFGRSHRVLLDELLKALEDSWSGIRPFSTLSEEEIVRLTGVKPHQVHLMKERGYDEPFLFEGEGVEGLIARFEARGLKVVKGGRFYHLMGNHDKGKAVRRLIDLFRGMDPGIKTIAIGDSENDLSMLKVVDLPVLVRRWDGSYAATRIDGRDPILARGAGPEGWSEAIFRILGR